jgi:hypothetical protein
MVFYKRTVSLLEKVVHGNKRLPDPERTEILSMLAEVRKKAKPNPPTPIELLQKSVAKVDKIEKEIATLQSDIAWLDKYGNSHSLILLKDKFFALQRIQKMDYPDIPLRFYSYSIAHFESFLLMNGYDYWSDINPLYLHMREKRIKEIKMIKETKLHEKITSLNKAEFVRTDLIVKLVTYSKKQEKVPVDIIDLTEE